MNELLHNPKLPRARATLWDVSALVYRHTYDEAAHGIDERVLDAVEASVAGNAVLDAGCGPGVVVPRFLAYGARKVIAVDVSEAMLRQVPNLGSVETVAADLQPGAISTLRRAHAPEGFGLVWFKRSLYHDDVTAVGLLNDAYSSLRPGGSVVVIHPESSLSRYVFDRRDGEVRLAGYTAYHAFNRAISEVLRVLRVHDYRHRSAAQLLSLGQLAAPTGAVSLLPTSISAFNVLVIEKKP